MKRDIATDFLYWNPMGGGFPNPNILIGVEFEVGGTHEDFGFSIFKKQLVEETGYWALKTIATGRTLREAIEMARNISKP